MQRAGFYLIGLLVLASTFFPQGSSNRYWIAESFFIATLILGIALLAISISYDKKITLNKIDLVVIFLLLYMIICNPLISVIKGSSIENILLISLPFLLIGSYFLFKHFISSIKEYHLISNLFVVCAITICIGVYYSYLNIGIGLSSFSRPTGIEGVMTFTLPILPIACVMTFSRVLTSLTKRKLFINLILFVFIFIAILLTETRGLFLSSLSGILLFLIFFVFQAPKGQQLKAYFLVGFLFINIVAFTILFGIGLLERFVDEGDREIVTILGRLDEFNAFYNGFQENKIFGKGLGSVFEGYSEFDLSLNLDGLTTCHSHLFFILGTTGIVGAILYYVPIFLSIYILLIKPNSKINKLFNSELQIVACAFSAGFIFTLSSTTFNSVVYNLFLGFLLYSANLKLLK